MMHDSHPPAAASSAAAAGAESNPALAADDVMAALRTVIDPEVGLDIVTLGLIYLVEVSADDVVIRYTLTTPGCPLSEYIKRAILEAVRPLAGARELRARLVFEPRWTPDLISGEAAW
jgi:metal-sulfur cluster biosynthetic enzyme